MFILKGCQSPSEVWRWQSASQDVHHQFCMDVDEHQVAASETVLELVGQFRKHVE
jgi:hypothetical protein